MFFPPSIQTSCATFFYLLKPAQPFVRAHHCAQLVHLLLHKLS